jgi:hypothetical protein
MTGPAYKTPAAFRAAVTDRLRVWSEDHPGAPLADLQRQFAYDRLLARVFLSEPNLWVLKGATAMLARLGGSARHSVDVDLYRREGSLDAADRELRSAAARDLGDYFQFTLSPGRVMTMGARALRVPVVAYLGATPFATFHVDLVVDLRMTGSPEASESLVPVELPGLVRTAYRIYPIADHIADKVCAMLEVHPRGTASADPSTRYRDLVDLAVFAHTASVAARELGAAVRSEAARRNLVLPERMAIPVGPGWPAGYSRLARSVPGLGERDIAAALATVGLFVDPILGGTAKGRWDADRLRWRTKDQPHT